MDDKFMTTVKIGPKGQIIIPKEVRTMFEMNPGDSVIIFADKKRGIAVQRADYLRSFMDAVFDGKKKDMLPDSSVEDNKYFSEMLNNEMKKGD